MDEYMAMWKNFFNFRERTTVRGFWMAVLFNFIIAIILLSLSKVLGIFGIIYSIYTILAIIPYLALSVRRLHDINKSGGWIFLSLIPFVGGIILIIWFIQRSVDDDNRFGIEQV
ncbi:MAG: DUF805 domain-containing protein [Lacrimispora sp.]